MSEPQEFVYSQKVIEGWFKDRTRKSGVDATVEYFTPTIVSVRFDHRWIPEPIKLRLPADAFDDPILSRTGDYVEDVVTYWVRTHVDDRLIFR